LLHVTTRPPTARRLILLAVGALLAAVVLLAGAGPASAHAAEGGAPVAGDYAYRVDDFEPGVPGIALRHIATTGQLQLTNRSDIEVTVLGYSDEPYLRVGPDGVWRNERSPATYLDADPSGKGAVPAAADPTAPPEWTQVSESTSVRWHDHRSHWMGGTPTGPSVGPTEIAHWSIPFLVGDQRVDATGTTSWAPGPDPLPWLVAMGALAVVVAAVGLTRRWWDALAAGAWLLLVATVADVAGTWWAAPGGVLDKAPTASAVLLVALCPLAGLLLVHTDRRAGTALVGLGAVTLLALVGWSGWGYLDSSQLPSGLPPDLARAAVAVTLGSAAGLVVVALRRGLPRHRPVAVPT
jgi:hypothetical protein